MSETTHDFIAAGNRLAADAVQVIAAFIDVARPGRPMPMGGPGTLVVTVQPAWGGLALTQIQDGRMQVLARRDEAGAVHVAPGVDAIALARGIAPMVAFMTVRAETDARLERIDAALDPVVAISPVGATFEVGARDAAVNLMVLEGPRGREMAIAVGRDIVPIKSLNRTSPLLERLDRALEGRGASQLVATARERAAAGDRWQQRSRGAAPTVA